MSDPPPPPRPPSADAPTQAQASPGGTTGLSDAPPALTTPPFPNPYPDRLILNNPLDQALKDAIGVADWRVAMCIVALNDDGTRHMAHYKGNEVHYSASLVKVAAMYSAFELRQTLVNIAAELGATAKKETLLKWAAHYLKPHILAKAASLSPLAGVQEHHALPKYSTTFQVVPAASGTGWSVEFTPGFQKNLYEMISISSNGDAAECIHGSGYGYLNGALSSGGFLAASGTSGVFLAGDYQGTYPAFRIPAVNEDVYAASVSKSSDGTAQAATALNLARLATLIQDWELVDKVSSQSMMILLKSAVDRKYEVWTPAATGYAFTAAGAKVGLGQLGKDNTGPFVESEVAVLTHTASGRRFIVAWQNNLSSDGRSRIGQVVLQTVTNYVAAVP